MPSADWKCIALPSPLAALVCANAWEELIFNVVWGPLFPNFPSAEWCANVEKPDCAADLHLENPDLIDGTADLSSSSLRVCSDSVRSWYAQLRKIPALSALLDGDSDNMMAYDLQKVVGEMSLVAAKLDHWASCLEGDLPVSAPRSRAQQQHLLGSWGGSVFWVLGESRGSFEAIFAVHLPHNFLSHKL